MLVLSAEDAGRVTGAAEPRLESPRSTDSHAEMRRRFPSRRLENRVVRAFTVSFLAWVFLLPARLPADELRLPNGDRLQGRLLKRENGQIHFESPWLGVVVIEEAKASVVQPSIPPEALAGLPPDAPARPAKAPPPTSPAASSTPASTPAAGLKPPPRGEWKGKLEVGLNLQAGRRDKEDVALRAEAQKKTGRDDYRLNGRYLYGRTDTSKNTDRTDASFRWRRELSEKVFGQTQTSYLADQIKGIDLNLEQNAGFGYRFLRRTRHTGSAGLGLTAQYRDSQDYTRELIYLGELFQDYTYKVSSRITFAQDANFQYSPDGRGVVLLRNNQTRVTTTEIENYKLRLNAALQGKLSESLSLNLRYEYEYDHALLDPALRTDHRITSSLGFSF